MVESYNSFCDKTHDRFMCFAHNKYERFKTTSVLYVYLTNLYNFREKCLKFNIMIFVYIVYAILIIYLLYFMFILS